MEKIKEKKSNMLILIWIFTIVISQLPTIIIKELFLVEDILWLNIITLVFSIIFLFSSLIWKKLRFISTFAMFITLLKALLLCNSLILKQWFTADGFVSQFAIMQFPRLLIAFIIINFLYIIKKNRHDFYLSKGNIKAIAQPAKFIVDKPTPWNKVGKTMSIYICGITLIFLLIASVPTLKQLIEVLPLIPFIIIFALMNSFSENIIYRLSFITILKDQVGEKQALYLTTFVFAMGHYYGAPYGITGVLMAAFLGWFLGKSIIETKGIFWAWSIHFLQDLLIMTFLAIGTVTLGG